MREYTHTPMDGCMCATSEWLTICSGTIGT